MRPRIGITPDLVDGKVVLSPRYLDSVAAAGGLPLVLAPQPALAADYVACCDGILLTGGDDVIMEDFGETTHASAITVDRHRQDFELAMLAALEAHPERPVLGVCLGMQLMGIEHEARFEQHLPDSLDTAIDHRHDALHLIEGDWLNGSVTSHHHQALLDGGRLDVIARAHDGVVEGVSHPSRPFYVGVQWHPERTDDEQLGPGLFRRLIEACGGSPEAAADGSGR
jgi:putative glutamine amidotransferase